QALLRRARVLAALGRPLESVKDYSRAIALSAEPRPEYYLERAHSLAGAGRTIDALRGLDEGIEKLGPLVTLESAAVELELAEGRFDEALLRVDRLTTQGERHETWLARRGEILELAHRRHEALAAYRAALDSIAAL